MSPRLAGWITLASTRVRKGCDLSLDPIAVYGAILSTLIVVRGLLRSRSLLRCVVTTDWPDAVPDLAPDSGIDFRDMHLRIDITNESARPVTVSRAGLVVRFDDCPWRWYDRLRPHLARFYHGVSPVPASCRGLIALTIADRRSLKRLEEHDTWSASRTADEVSHDIAGAPRGRSRVAGAYAETSTGAVHFWGLRAIRDDWILDELYEWHGGGYFDVLRERPARPDDDEEEQETGPS